MTSLEETLARLKERRPALIDLGLARMHETLRALGDPHRRLPPIFHVAGTNGKGSTVAYLKAMLATSGARVHVYTSPHLVRFNERIELAGDVISDEALIDVLAACDRAAGERPLSFFETATCAAFLAFAEAQADFAILEVGLGGRLDATNVIEKPAAALITPVALDHQSYLGDNVATIAREKAGIMRAQSPAVIGPQSAEAMTALLSHADEINARSRAFGMQWNAFLEHGRLVYQDENGLSDLSPPKLAGVHQVMNAGLAVAGVKAAGLDFGDDMLSRGLVSAQWPGRLQRLTTGPLVEALARSAPPGSELWLDGGHNPHAARAVAAAISDLEERASAHFTMIIGMQTGKDARGYFEPFAGLAAKVFTVAAQKDTAARPEDIAAAAQAAGVAASPCASVQAALEAAMREGEGARRILIGGSLYLAGDVLRDHA